MKLPLLLGLLTLTNHVEGQLKGYSEEDGPSLAASPTKPVIKRTTETALITCIVQNQGENSLMWKKASKVPEESPTLLSVNKEMITRDKRMQVLHATNGQVYVLQITNLTLKDAGTYFCEVNTDTPIRSFTDLTVVQKYKKVKKLSSVISSTAFEARYNFTSCCVSLNVSTTCQEYCHVHTLLDGITPSGPPEQCESDFPAIVSCLADGRNHLPCCLDIGIPEECTSVCRGEFNRTTDTLEVTDTCKKYISPTLSCIATGIETIPKQPVALSADAVNDTAIEVYWNPASDEFDVLDHFVLNITFMRHLTPEFGKIISATKSRKYTESYSTQLTLPKNKTEIIIGGLQYFSVYGVEIRAVGKKGGQSLPSTRVMVVTHVPGENSNERNIISRAPATPDIRTCCQKERVHDSCVTNFCDPHNVAYITQEDLMICAPWDTEIFTCLADGVDHSPCCRAKGLPDLCQELCTGNITQIDFRYFGCLSHMNELSSCLLSGYGVLPSSPQHFRLSNIKAEFAILHWDKPRTLGDTVLGYVVNARKIQPEVGDDKAITHVHSPFILDKLESGATYEVFVEAVNEHGIGEPSIRQIFKTPTKARETALEEVFEHPYNPANCCAKSGVKPECLPLCSFSSNSSHMDQLWGSCADDFSSILRCTNGGRDHLGCCKKRFVPEQCSPLCQSVHQQSTGSEMGECIHAMDQIFSCFEEGTVLLPPPVRDFRALSVKDGKVFLAWSWRSDNMEKPFGNSHFEVYYREANKTEKDGDVFAMTKQVNTKLNFIKIDGLDTGKLYRFMVVTRNDRGTSLPSSVVTLNVSRAAYEENEMKGSTSPPHQLQLRRKGVDWLQFTWNPPAISHPEDELSYNLYWKPVKGDNDGYVVHTPAYQTMTYLENLLPGTQYEVYVTTVKNKDKEHMIAVESYPSEVLSVWTEEFTPARVKISIVQNKTTEETADQVTVGGTMIVVCLATGFPTPRVIMSINGVELHSQVTKHMITVVHNITRDVDLVTCYANNGYGTPMVASKRVVVSRPPTISAPMSTTVIQGDTLIMKCKVDAFPAPSMAFYRDKNLTKSVEGEDIDIIASSTDDDAKYSLTLKVRNTSIHDGSMYYCHASNSLGNKTALMGVHVKQLPVPITNVTECCINQNVTTDCLDICSFSLDFDTMLRKPQCIPQFHQLMSCASDGSDHRHCCSTKGVPGICLNWCRGELVEESETCAVEHSRAMIECFHEGKDNLPGPPQNVKVTAVDESSVIVSFDKPAKNPDAVDVYRVFWRPVGVHGANKSDIVETKIILHDLQTDVSYEVVAKAGNSKGTSVLTEPVIFHIAHKLDVKQVPLISVENSPNTAWIILSILVIIVVVSSLVFILHKKNLIVCIVKKPERPIRIENPFRKPEVPSVAFENPFYNIQNPPTGSGVITQVNADAEYNSYLSSSWPMEAATSSSSESSSGENTPREQEDTEPRRFSLTEKMASIKTGVNHGKGFERF